MAKVPLVLQKKRQFYENPKWITIDKLYDSALRYVINEQIDIVLKNYGEIIVATHYEMDKFGFRTGKRKSCVEVSKDLERWQEIDIQTLIEGKEISAKGCVNIYYRGQPYICRSCQVKHCEKCPQQIANKLLRNKPNLQAWRNLRLC